MSHYELLLGDCLEKLKELPDCSVDAVVTDPPAGIAFMGKDWDTDKGGRREWIAWLASVMSECLRILKPGGHAFVWALPRTSHWTATALEDAGFEVRECVVHLFGSGFPKSLNVGKAIDKMAGVEFDQVPASGVGFMNAEGVGGCNVTKNRLLRKGESTDAARQWEGFGTALKPASEHWWLCRKPLIGTVAANVLAHGVGGINVDGCRVGTETRIIPPAANKPGGSALHMSVRGMPADAKPTVAAGRWPPNAIFSHLPACDAETCAESCAVAELDAQSGTRTSGKPGGSMRQQRGTFSANATDTPLTGYGDSGGASRFFPVFRYQAKPSRREREAGLREAVVRTGCAGEMPIDDAGNDRDRFSKLARNTHPTVKPIELMRWLVRLVTPPGGVVLDPFTGSGTTGVAAILEGFRFIGCEREDEYFALAKARLDNAVASQGSKQEKQPMLFDLEGMRHE